MSLSKYAQFRFNRRIRAIKMKKLKALRDMEKKVAEARYNLEQCELWAEHHKAQILETFDFEVDKLAVDFPDAPGLIGTYPPTKHEHVPDYVKRMMKTAG